MRQSNSGYGSLFIPFFKILNGVEVSWVKVIHYIGVFLDSHLLFEDQVEGLCTGISCVLVTILSGSRSSITFVPCLDFCYPLSMGLPMKIIWKSTSPEWNCLNNEGATRDLQITPLL